VALNGKARGGSVGFERVVKRYGDAPALVDFNLEIEPGEFVTLLGPSGSGKTTALNILAGFTGLSAGDVKIGGRSVTELPPERRNVGMVFQSFSLFPHMSVFDNVAFPLRLRRIGRAEIRRRAMEVLEMVRLDDLASRKPNELSGGQRQRVAFARAVVFEPPVLLMDEPLSALDLKLREAMQLEIRRYHSEIGCTIVFVTHDQTEALTLSDRIAVMCDGRIVQVDTPERVYDRPTSRFVAEFIGQTNLLSLTPAANGGAWIEAIDAIGPHFATGGVTAISLRPEKLRRAPAEPSEPGFIAFDAVVDEPLFLGEVVQYSVRVPSGRTLLFKERRGDARSALKKNEAVRLGFRPEDAVPISEDQAIEPT
jgi:putative spermidine/putrescine transport system ATP-binding protein